MSDIALEIETHQLSDASFSSISAIRFSISIIGSSLAIFLVPHQPKHPQIVLELRDL